MNGLVVLAVLVFGYALVAARLERYSVTAPVVFVGIGVLLGPSGLGVLPSALDTGPALRATELALALLLFADAASVPAKDVRGDLVLPRRLLLVGLPLTMVVGTLCAHLLFPAAGWALAALIATILAPTDAALGMAVVANPSVPNRIRRALNVESGLNDGIATPFVTACLAGVVAEQSFGAKDWVWSASQQIGLAVLAAVVVGGVGGALLRLAADRGWTAPLPEQLAVLALALVAYDGSVRIGGNGFVAAFGAGLVFGAASQRRFAEPLEFTDSIGLYLSYFVWVVFGALLVNDVTSNGFHPRALVYAVLSLTVVRMVPVALALAGLGLRRDTIAFVGWFGPRGLASVVFTLIAFEELHQTGSAAAEIVEVATWTILLSVVAHGMSAGPWARAYGRRVSGATDAPELQAGAGPRPRRSLAGR